MFIDIDREGEHRTGLGRSLEKGILKIWKKCEVECCGKSID
jgi:hypothetical protein